MERLENLGGKKASRKVDTLSRGATKRMDTTSVVQRQTGRGGGGFQEAHDRSYVRSAGREPCRDTSFKERSGYNLATSITRESGLSRTEMGETKECAGGREGSPLSSRLDR